MRSPTTSPWIQPGTATSRGGPTRSTASRWSTPTSPPGTAAMTPLFPSFPRPDRPSSFPPTWAVPPTITGCRSRSRVIPLSSGEGPIPATFRPSIPTRPVSAEGPTTPSSSGSTPPAARSSTRLTWAGAETTGPFSCSIPPRWVSPSTPPEKPT